MRILVRSPNWIGDVVMSMPVVRALRKNFSDSEIIVIAKKTISLLWSLNPDINGLLEIQGFFSTIKKIREGNFDIAIILPNSFKSALMIYLAGVPERIGYATECRGFLLTEKIPLPINGFRKKHLIEEYLDILIFVS